MILTFVLVCAGLLYSISSQADSLEILARLSKDLCGGLEDDMPATDWVQKIKSGDRRLVARELMQRKCFEKAFGKLVESWFNGKNSTTSDFFDVPTATAIFLATTNDDFSKLLTWDNVASYGTDGVLAVRTRNNGAAQAGVLTTNQFLTHFNGSGPHRQTLKRSVETFLCTTIEGFQDGRAPTSDNPAAEFPVRRAGSEIMPAPGQAATCFSCHAKMDPLARAFLRWTPNVDPAAGNLIEGMYSSNPSSATRPRICPGNGACDDNWIWFEEPGKEIQGQGAKAFGQYLVSKPEFAQCISRKLFERLTGKPLSDSTAKAVTQPLGEKFKASQYNIKALIEEIVASPSYGGAP
jgi:hypothetical protein